MCLFADMLHLLLRYLIMLFFVFVPMLTWFVLEDWTTMINVQHQHHHGLHSSHLLLRWFLLCFSLLLFPTYFSSMIKLLLISLSPCLFESCDGSVWQRPPGNLAHQLCAGAMRHNHTPRGEMVPGSHSLASELDLHLDWTKMVGQVMCKFQSCGLDFGTSDPATLVLHLSTEAHAMFFEDERPSEEPLRDPDSTRRGRGPGVLKPLLRAVTGASPGKPWIVRNNQSSLF